jgi:hypothetical protein
MSGHFAGKLYGFAMTDKIKLFHIFRRSLKKSGSSLRKTNFQDNPNQNQKQDFHARRQTARRLTGGRSLYWK